MRACDGNPRFQRDARIEKFEPRLVLSAQPLGPIHLDYLVEEQIEQQVTPDTDVGTVSFTELGGLNHQAGDTWYRMEASRNGTLTVEASFSHAAGNVDLELYGASGQNLLGASGGTSDLERIDVAATAGQVYFLKATGGNADVDLRLTNLVSQSGTVVDVYSSVGSDAFEFAAGSTHTVTVNGVAYQFNSSAVNLVRFHGGAGDKAYLYDSSGDETFVADPNGASLSGAGFACEVDGFSQVYAYASSGNDQAQLQGSAGSDDLLATGNFARLRGGGYYNFASGFGEVVVQGGAGNDVAYLYDSVGSDTLTASPGDVRISGAGFDNQAVGFESVYAYASTGNDVANLYGSAGVDDLLATHEFGRLSGSGYYHFASGFDQVNAFSGGGADRAEFRDSPDDDLFAADPTTAQMSGTGFDNRATGFRFVYAYATDGNDVAQLSDSAGDDDFLATSNFGRLRGANYYNFASGFSQVQALASVGYDQALLYDSTGDETFTASSTSAQLAGATFDNRAAGFDRVEAIASSGNDQAVLSDSSGDDTFNGYTTYSTLEGGGFYLRATSFDLVYAYASTGTDRAYLHGTSGSDDLLATQNFARLRGSGYYNFAGGFGEAMALAGAGNDTATFYDSAGADTLTMLPTSVRLTGASFDNWGDGFETVYAYGSTGGDLALLYGSAGSDDLLATSNFARLRGSGYYNFAGGFAQSIAYAQGGVDKAYLYDSAGADTLTASPTNMRLSGAGFDNQADGFDEVFAYGSDGADTAYLYDSSGDDDLRTTNTYARLRGPGYYNFASGFDTVYSYASGGNDRAELFDSQDDNTLTIRTTHAALDGTDFYVEARGFDAVTAHSLSGGRDMTDFEAVDYALDMLGAWIIPVAAGDDLQAVIDAAQSGNIIELEAGATFAAGIVAPAKQNADWITIRSSEYDQIGENRATPDDAVHMARIVTTDDTPTLWFEFGATKYRIVGVEFASTAAATSNLISMGKYATTVSQLPSHIEFDRVYVHGNDTGEIGVGIVANARHMTIRRSWISNIHLSSGDSQAILAWNSPGPWLIEDNYLEAAGENIMFGGATKTIPGITPSGITVRGNHFHKPIEWRNESWVVKNLFEIKDGANILLEGNVMENNWIGSQHAFAIVLTPKGGGARCEDVVIRDNIIRHAGSAFQIMGGFRSFVDPSIPPSVGCKRITIENNLLYDINDSWDGGGWFLQLSRPTSGPDLDPVEDLTVRNNTFIAEGVSRSMIQMGELAPAVRNLVFTDNIITHGDYGITGTGSSPGVGALNDYADGWIFAGNGIIGVNQYVALPTGNDQVATVNDVGFVDPAGQDYRLQAGSAFAGKGADVDAILSATSDVVTP